MGLNISKNRKSILKLLREKKESKERILELQNTMQAIIPELQILNDKVSKCKGNNQRKIKQLGIRKSKLLKELNKFKREKLSRIFNSLRKVCLQAFRHNIAYIFYKWANLNSLAKPQPLGMDLEIRYESILTDLDTTEAIKATGLKYKKIVDNNLIFKILRIYNQKSKETMGLKQLILLFESTIFSKHMQDIRNIDNKTKPCEFTEFLLESLYKKYKNPEAVVKALAQLVNSVEKYRESSNYIRFLSGFIQFSQEDSMDYSISQFFFEIMLEINKFIKYKEAKSCDFSNLPILTRASEGGVLYLSDIFDLVHSKFPKKKLRTLLIDSFQPQYSSKEEYFIFTISYLMKKCVFKPEAFYDMLDINQNGSLDPSTLIQGFEKHLKIWLRPEHRVIIYTVFTDFYSEEISKSKFLEQFPVGLDGECYSRKKNYPITKYKALDSLLKIYKLLEIKATAYLFKVFDEQKVADIDLYRFKSIVRVIDPSISKRSIKDIYNKGKDIHSLNKTVTRDTFASILISFGIGDEYLKYFSKIYLGTSSIKADFKPSSSEVVSMLTKYYFQENSPNSSIPTTEEYY